MMFVLRRTDKERHPGHKTLSLWFSAQFSFICLTIVGDSVKSKLTISGLVACFCAWAHMLFSYALIYCRSQFQIGKYYCNQYAAAEEVLSFLFSQMWTWKDGFSVTHGHSFTDGKPNQVVHFLFDTVPAYSTKKRCKQFTVFSRQTDHQEAESTFKLSETNHL